jgi:hypothetical protein
VFLPLFTIASTRTTLRRWAILEMVVLLHLRDVSLIFRIEIEIVVLNFAMFQGFNQASVIQGIGLWTGSLVCLLRIKIFWSRYFFSFLFLGLRL